MINASTYIAERKVILPEWLDTFIFDDLSASYCRQNQNMVVLDWDNEAIKRYLGTYFPRSFAEAYCIFSRYLSKQKGIYAGKTDLSVFDFGCGTGGELIGLIVAISEQLPDIKNITARALDGNAHALRHLERLLKETSTAVNIDFEFHLSHIVVDDIYDMGIVTDVISQRFDFILSFKAICELVTRSSSNAEPCKKNYSEAT